MGLLGLCAVSFGPGMIQLSRMSWQRYELQHRLHALQAQQQELTAEQQQLMSNPVYVEGLIRSTFKVAQPDELVVPLNDRPSR